MQRPGIQDVALFNPPSACLPDPISKILKIEDAVGVGIDAEHDALLFRLPAIGVGQIKPDRMRVHFEKAAALSGMADDTSHVHVVGRSFIDKPAAGMGQDRKIGMVHGAEDPLGLLLPRESEMAMDGPDDEIEALQVFIRKIQAAILQNVDLDPLQ